MKLGRLASALGLPTERRAGPVLQGLVCQAGQRHSGRLHPKCTAQASWRERPRDTIVRTERATEIDWHAQYEVHGPDLLAFLRRAVGDVGTAEDLLQETFARAIRADDRVPVDAVRPWLFRVASNLATSHHRRRKLLAFLPFSSEHPSLRTEFDVEADLVRAALKSIPSDQAVALTLALHDGFSRREIAEMLEISEEAIKSRIARGRRNFAAAYRQLNRGAKQ